MKKALSIFIFIIMAIYAFAEEPKVFRDDDLIKYKSGDNSSTTNESEKNAGNKLTIYDELKKENEVCRDNYNSRAAYSVSLEKIKTIITVIENASIDSITKLRLLEYGKACKKLCEIGIELRDAEMQRDLHRRR
jgi:hypothetical protein